MHTDALWSEATGQHTATIVVTNRGPTCVLDGYPKLVLLDARHHVLRFIYSHRGDQMITSERPRSVRVAHGRSVYFSFNKYRCDIHALASAVTAHVRLPGSHRWLAVRLSPVAPPFDYCHEAPSLYVAVSPIAATRAGTAQSH